MAARRCGLCGESRNPGRRRDQIMEQFPNTFQPRTHLPATYLPVPLSLLRNRTIMLQ